MKTLKYITGLFVAMVMLISVDLQGQNWAGPDTTICQDAGVVLGLGSAPNDYCYNWSPAKGLSSTTDKQPTAHPDQNTEYTLVAIGPNFSNKVVDKVNVIVATGGVVVTPTYTEPTALPNQAHAHLTSKSAGTNYIWSIEGAKHGCQINSSTGNISYCNELGDVTIKATEQNNPACSATGTLRINVGVKEVFAIDAANPTRKASNGQTLHLVGINSVNLKAIPNTGEAFGDDQPDWTGSTVMPPHPHDAEWNHDAGTPTSMTITAGQKNVLVSRESGAEVSAGGFSHTLLTLFDAIKEFVKPSAELEKGHSFDGDATSACSPFDAVIDHNISYKKAPVNKKDSPDVGYAYTLEGELKGEITGKVCFPPPYSSVPNPVFVWSTYVVLSGSGKFTVNITKDESVKVPSEWMFNELNLAADFKLGIGGEVGLFIPGDLFGVTGSLFGGVKIGVDPDVVPHYLDVKSTIEPLVIEGGLKVWYLNPDNTLIDLSGKYNLLDPINLGPYHVIHLDNFGH